MGYANLGRIVFGNKHLFRMSFSGLRRRMALVRTVLSEESIASIIKLTRISELGTRLAATSYRNAAE
jgi:hypothetical protein